ncbi:MAG: response regulator [Qipengyuania vulgaris]
MCEARTILLVEDEPLILMDLEFAAEDAGLTCLPAPNLAEALRYVESHGERLDVAVLDVSLTGNDNCLPIARELDARGIPYVIHSGDLDRKNELIRSLDAPRIAKPSSSDRVVELALSLLESGESANPSAAIPGQ